MSVTATLFLTFVGLLVIGAPLTLSLGAAALAGMITSGMPIEGLVEIAYTSVNSFPIMALPAFILSGALMESAGISRRLVAVAEVLAGSFVGGMGTSTILSCLFFGAISGSTVATVVALGGFMIPALIKHGYPEKYTLGLMTTSPNLGVIIPPSIGMILFSMISNVSLEGLFLTGFLPGVLIMAGVCVYTYLLFRKRTEITRMPVPNVRETLAVLKEGFWSLMLPVIIFGGIFSGAFTANEAAVVACVYAFIVELFIHKSMKLSQVKEITVSSAVTSATLLIIVAGATCFGRLLTLESIPGRITETVLSAIQSPMLFLFAMNVLLLFVGMFMDIISATMILGPVFLPMLQAFDISWMHFGLIMTVNLAIGYCTPPMGVSLYITGAMANRNLIYVSKAVIPFIVIQMIVLGIITYMPDMVLWLPKFFGYLE